MLTDRILQHHKCNANWFIRIVNHEESTGIQGFLHVFQNDLADIKDKFQGKFDITLEEYVESDCGGDYKNMLLAILKE